MNKRSIYISVVFVFFTAFSYGQEISKEVKNRLRSITNAVAITENEKKEIMVSIERFLNSSKEIRKAKREHMSLEIKENSNRYLTEILVILDDERYEVWQESLKNNSTKDDD